RLSRGMAARSTAARQELRTMVGRKSSVVAAWAAPAAGRGVARRSGNAGSGRPGERAGDTLRRAAVHRVSARLPRRAFRHELVAARPVSDAGKPEGIAGADFCTARRDARRPGARWLAV